MLELHKLLWVVPGVVFIHIYNKRRPIDSINLSGWSYLFSLVITAVFMWLPVEILFKDKSDVFGRWEVLVLPVASGLLSCFIALVLTSSAIMKRPNRSYFFTSLIITAILWLFVEIVFFNELSFFDKQRLVRLWMPAVSALILFILPHSNIIFFNVQDSFLANCIRWENSPVILSLRNDKVYIGVLLKYPENPRERSESQTISIIPLISGGRDKDTKEVKWGKFYPKKNDKKDELHDCEISISRNEIITFGKFNQKVFEHFRKSASEESG